MRTQQDSTVRVVALDNLRAMCDRISGTAHTFEVSKVSRSRVHVEYSNPTEYGTPNPVTAVFPCYPSIWPDDSDNPRVVLDILRTFAPGERDRFWKDEVWQHFTPLLDCPSLFRSGGTVNDWQTREEWEATK